MTQTTGGSFPGGSYLSGAMPTEEQLAYAVPKERKGPRDVATEPHDVVIGMDHTLKIGWQCRHCGESQTDFANGPAARDSAQEHAGPNGRVLT